VTTYVKCFNRGRIENTLVYEGQQERVALVAVVMMVGRSEADILEVEDDAGLLTMACMKDLMQKRLKM